MAIELQARPYGDESTPDEVAAIRDRVWLYRAPDLIMYFEVPVPSPFQIRLFGKKLDELTANLKQYDLLVDLTHAKPPGAEVREALKEMFGKQPKCRKVGVFTGRNFMLNVAARFVLGSVGLKDFTVSKTLEEALKTLGR
jgi:hypothetical protein